MGILMEVLYYEIIEFFIETIDMKKEQLFFKLTAAGLWGNWCSILILLFKVNDNASASNSFILTFFLIPLSSVSSDKLREAYLFLF